MKFALVLLCLIACGDDAPVQADAGVDAVVDANPRTAYCIQYCRNEPGGLPAIKACIARCEMVDAGAQ